MASPPPASDGDTRLVLIRHGESVAQQRRSVGGHHQGEGLTALGRRQVEALRDRAVSADEWSGATALYSSVMPRAVETASILAAATADLEITQDCDVCEFHHGEGDDLSWDRFNELYPVADAWDPNLRRAPGSETWSEMAERVARGLDRIIDRHMGTTVIIACHGGVIVHSLVRWLGLDTNDMNGRAWLRPVNSSITEWRFSPDPHAESGHSIELVRFNDHAHLAAL